MDECKCIKHWSFPVALMIIVILMASCISSNLETNKRDYTGITEHCIPDIAIDFTHIYTPPETEWKLSRKRLTDKRRWR